MTTMISGILGGIGMFLLGMILLTEGLKALAGDSMRTFLARFTGGRFSSLAAGAAVTTVVQSSSATTLATIGFVSAGLITFQQAVGVLLGANLGTTSTGWLVSVLGLKFSISKLALPLIGFGAITRLLARARLANVGIAIAGFGLVFVGIDTLQTGMQTLSTRIDPSTFPGPTLSGRLLLVLIGAAMTVVMQSSSAAIATTLTALHSETIELTQAAALVIGQNVGTTVTAGIASMGATAAAKRTALAHILFNVFTGALAFVILPVGVRILGIGSQRLGIDSPAILLAAFHTSFNLLGVAAFVPFLGPFSRLVARLVPERGPRLTRHLGAVVAQGPLAIDAAGLTLRETLEEALKTLLLLLRPQTALHAVTPRLEEVDDALAQTREFLAQIRSGPEAGSHYARHLRLLHVLDHLDRLSEACREKTFLDQVRGNPDVVVVLRSLEHAVQVCVKALHEGAPLPQDVLEKESKSIANVRKHGRPRLLVGAAEGRLTPAVGAKILETVRWIDRLAFHVWRGGHHLFEADPTSISDAALPGGAVELESAERREAKSAESPGVVDAEPHGADE